MKRTPYMQKIMNETYPKVTIMAIQEGTIDGAWEKLILCRLWYYPGGPQRSLT